MNSGKKIIVIAIFMYLISSFTFGIPIKANNTTNVRLKTLEISNDYREYANSIYKIHINALLNEETDKSPSNYILGEPFTLINPLDETYTVFFPILNNNSIKYLLKISKDNNSELSASLSIYFAEKIEMIYDYFDKDFVLLTDGLNIIAFDNDKSFCVYNLVDSEDNSVINSNLLEEFNELEYDYYYLSYFDLFSPKFTQRGSTPTITIIDQKTINVSGVSQNGHPWCWAATCDALINYYKGKSLSASDIANYIFPNNSEQGGSWTEIKKAYNHWGLYPIQTGLMSFGTVRTNINNNKPMHLGLTGHSVGLIGFSYYDIGGGETERILILLEPNGGIKKTVKLKSNNNFDYYLCGDNSWIYTRYF